MRRGISFIGAPGLLVLVCSSFVFGADDSAGKLKQAESLVNNKQFEQAEQVYLDIARQAVDAQQRLAAQKGLAILYVRWDKEAQADKALQDLIAGFSHDKAIASAVTNVADAYRQVEKHTKACEIYQYVIDNWPADEHAMWSQMGLAISNIHTANKSAAEAAFEQLCTNYSGHKLLGRATCLVADSYRALKNYQQSAKLYQLALAAQPDEEYALWSQMGLAVSNMHLGQYDTASDQIQTILTRFAKDQGISIAACLMADQYRALNRHKEAAGLYEYVVNNWPGAEHTLWSQMGLAMCNLWMVKSDAASTAADKLLSDYAKDSRQAVAVCLLADEYRKMQQRDKACELYTHVVKTWPDTEHAMWSHIGLAKCDVWLGNDQQVDASIERIIARWKDHPDAARGLFQIAEQYNNKAFRVSATGGAAQTNQCFQKAHQVWERIVTQLPESSISPYAYDFLARSYYDFGQFEKAVGYYQTLLEKWPAYETAWNSYYLLARSCEKLATSNGISMEKAEAIITNACLRVITDHPHCPAALNARALLDRWETIKNQMKEKANEP